MTKHKRASPQRCVTTYYYRFKRLVRTTRASYLDRACKTCFGSIETNKYQATYAEVVDDHSGKIYMRIYLTLEGDIHAFYDVAGKQKVRVNKRVLKKSSLDE